MNSNTLRRLGLLVASLATLLVAGLYFDADAETSDAERTMTEPSLEKRCEKEVHELHQFFQEWFSGDLENTDDAFARFSDVMDEGFVIISPSGQMSERAPLVAALRGAHDRWSESGAGKIWIENFRVHRLLADAAVVTYEEWQTSAGETRGRLSTAVFGPEEGTPNGVVWLHLHEVWLPER